MSIKMSGLIFVAINIVCLYFSFCPVWAKVNIILYVLSLLAGFVAMSSISRNDKVLAQMGLDPASHNKTFALAGAVCGLLSLIEMISSIILGIYFLINL